MIPVSGKIPRAEIGLRRIKMEPSIQMLCSPKISYSASLQKYPMLPFCAIYKNKIILLRCLFNYRQDMYMLDILEASNFIKNQ